MCSMNKCFRIVSHWINTEVTHQILPDVSPSCGSRALKSVVIELSSTRILSLSTVCLLCTGHIDALIATRFVKTGGCSDRVWRGVLLANVPGAIMSVRNNIMFCGILWDSLL